MPSLSTACNLLEMLEFSLVHAPKLETSTLPVNGILEIVRQVRLILTENSSTQEIKPKIEDEMFDNSYFGINGSPNVNYRPKVKTVPPEVRGRIRELVGIESEETF